MFSPQQDVEVGQQVSPDAERQLRMLKNARVDNYVNDLGRRLAAKAPGEKYPYRFKVVNNRTINAFTLPGGPIYINRGVMEAADNESQLAGVLAHEISHVALRHGTTQASKASAARMPLAILGGMIGSDSTKTVLAQLGASFAVNSILLKYSRSAESQAGTTPDSPSERFVGVDASLVRIDRPDNWQGFRLRARLPPSPKLRRTRHSLWRRRSADRHSLGDGGQPLRHIRGG